MRVLVTAASKHGSTEEIAEAIANVLTKGGNDAEVIPPEEVESLEEYEALVLGSAVYAGQWLEPAMDLVDRVAEVFTGRPVWLFSSGPVGEPRKPAEDPIDLEELLAITGARDHHVFPGKLVKKNLSFPERAITVALRVQEGDFRDWDEIEGWASRIADELEGAAVAGESHERG